MSEQTHTDCRSDDGITVGLIDTIITAARISRGRDFSPKAVQEALKDLIQDEDVDWLISQFQNEPVQRSSH